jgi:hypothetical protein
MATLPTGLESSNSPKGSNMPEITLLISCFCYKENMTSFVKVTSLAPDNKYLCCLLELDEAKILLDCGWTEDFNVEDLAYLSK